VGVLLAVAALLIVFGGLRAMRQRQDRLAEEAREHDLNVAALAAASAKAAAMAAVPPPPPVVPAAVASTAEAVASSEPEPTAAPSASESAPAASAVQAGQSAPAEPTMPAAGFGPAHPAGGPTRIATEAPLDVGPSAGGGLLAQASRAMSKGDVQRALDLARQAVASNPANADTWLTLGAAYQAAGNPSAARDAYKSCVKQAHSATISDCRVLAGR
jgi:tetratricopeptide (TPR) repeat protein